MNFAKQRPGCRNPRRSWVAFAPTVLALSLFLAAGTASAEWRALGDYRIAAYCPCARCCGKNTGITADGTYAPAYAGRLVAAPRNLPFGAVLWIEGLGTVTVHDRGSKLRGSRLDLFFKTHREALNWGVQHRKVFIWTGAEKPPPKQAP